MSTAKPEILETLSSPYNDVVVRRRKKRIDFDVAGATFATWHPKKMLTGYSWDAITTACMMMAEEPRSILLLGLAGGTVVRQLRALLPDTCISAVEIDEAVVDLGRRHMELDQLQCNVISDDAYEYLRTTDRSFDIVGDDVYRSGVDDVERPYQKIHDLVARMSRRIHRNGLVIANFVPGDDHQRRFPSICVYKYPIFSSLWRKSDPPSGIQHHPGRRHHLPAIQIRAELPDPICRKIGSKALEQSFH